MELTAITDESWLRHVNGFQPVETFAIDDYFFELYVIDEIGYPVNYLYRLLCYKEGIEQPILSLNTEFGPNYHYFHAATVGSKHINLGFSMQTETLEQFRNWALEQLAELLPEIQRTKVQYIQQKGLQLKEINYLSEFERKRMQKNISQLVELSNEYMFPIQFEETKEMFETSTLSVLNVKLLILESKQDRRIGAILFPKKEFTIEDISNWLFCYGVHYVRDMGEPIYVDQCSNVLFSYLADGYVLVMYIKGKNRKQVQHIYDTARNNDVSAEAFWSELDSKLDKTIYIDEVQVMNDETLELTGEVNIVYLNGMTMYADRIVIKSGTVSFMNREHNTVIAQVEQFSVMHIEVGELEYNEKAALHIQCCYIEYERTL